MGYFVYIMGSRPGGALYTGSTNNLRRRVEEHRAKLQVGHTAKYNITHLYWFEEWPTYHEALERELRIKGWKRAWKDKLILDANPEWRDVSADFPF
ncbi:GIY-YIG nuclease family protein [Cypionkella sinensis]|uniref:GIY-YIG nuclease family protein n=1 Tax=Cypionkella sinensis TaxID=1756043 RepID=A0ABV7IVL1_9RHOB